MHLVGRFPDNKRVGEAVDNLREIGYDRNDVVVSDLQDVHNSDPYITMGTRDGFEESLIKIFNIKHTLEEFGNDKPYLDSAKNLKGREGIIVTVKTPRYESDRVRDIMEQSGAIEIVQD